MDLLLHNLRTGGIRHDDWSVAREAADEIERLRDEVARLRRYADAMNGRAGTERHTFAGLCQDNNQPDSLDPDCPACQLLMSPNASAKGPGGSSPGPSRPTGSAAPSHED